MAYSASRTWTTGELVTAAMMNQEIRDNLNAAFPLGAPDVAWTTYTPTLTQSAAVTKTISRAVYTKIGRLVIVSVALSATGTGTASNKITVTLPVTAATGYASGYPIGAGYVYDASANIVYAGSASTDATTTAALHVGSGAVSAFVGATGGGMTAALASGDFVGLTATYESAT